MVVRYLRLPSVLRKITFSPTLPRPPPAPLKPAGP